MIQSIWPDTAPVPRMDRLLLRLGHCPGFCNLCGRLTVFRVKEANFREHTPCPRCHGVNRYRQMVAVLLRLALGDRAGRFSAIPDLPRDLVIWNTETTRALHERLGAHLGANYTASEFIDPALSSGTEVEGVLHVDMQKTHFADESLDFILSSDVVEHIPFYLDAMRETWRILRFGGAHVFTAPFYHHRFTVERRSEMREDGSIEHRFKPWYHGDPLRADGVLCFNVFAPELLVELERIGFEAQLLRLHDPLLGILGNNGFVFVARKTKDPNHGRDLIFPDPA
jgi:SAM-dependent methyltransferase